MQLNTESLKSQSFYEVESEDEDTYQVNWVISTQTKPKTERLNKSINQYNLAKQINFTILFCFHNREKLIVVNTVLDTRTIDIFLVQQSLFTLDAELSKDSVYLKEI